MPKKKTLTEAEAVALILKETRYRIDCEHVMPAFTLRWAEPDRSGRYPEANWEAMPGEGAESWPHDLRPSVPRSPRAPPREIRY